MEEGCAQIVVAPIGGVPVGGVVVMAMVVIVIMVMVVIMVVIMVMIVVMIIMIVSVAVPMVVVIVAQQKGAHQVDDETQECNRNGLVEGDLDRLEEALDRFVGDQQGHHREHDRAREGGQVAELAGAEGETLVMRIAAGVG